jgi:hypothetical protein
MAVTAAGCGGGTRQDASEPEGHFPVEISKAEFPTRQRLADPVKLVLAVKNTGQQTVPDLAITIHTDPNAQRPFGVVSNDPREANQTRPVWVLEHGFPQLAGASAPAGAQTANANTFQFGPLAPAESREAIWQLSPVRPGTYTLTYEVAAGLTGRADAVTEDGSVPTGRFLVRISGAPPKAGIGKGGKVIIRVPKR